MKAQPRTVAKITFKQSTVSDFVILFMLSTPIYNYKQSELRLYGSTEKFCR